MPALCYLQQRKALVFLLAFLLVFLLALPPLPCSAAGYTLSLLPALHTTGCARSSLSFSVTMVLPDIYTLSLPILVLRHYRGYISPPLLCFGAVCNTTTGHTSSHARILRMLQGIAVDWWISANTIVVALYGCCEALRWCSADAMKYYGISAWAGMRLYTDGRSGMDWAGIGLG